MWPLGMDIFSHIWRLVLNSLIIWKTLFNWQIPLIFTAREIGHSKSVIFCNIDTLKLHQIHSSPPKKLVIHVGQMHKKAG